MLVVVAQVLLAWLYSHSLEWVLHRFILHNPKRKRWFKTHFGDHHKASRKYSMIDPKYLKKASLQGDPEIKGLIVIAAAHIPLCFIFPWAYITLLFMGAEYWWIHRKSHRDPFWAREHLAWHYDHHLAPDQHANWGVRLPIFDLLLGTKKPYKGSKKEVIKYHLLKVKLEKIRESHARSRGNSSNQYTESD